MLCTLCLLPSGIVTEDKLEHPIFSIRIERFGVLVSGKREKKSPTEVIASRRTIQWPSIPHNGVITLTRQPLAQSSVCPMRFLFRPISQSLGVNKELGAITTSLSDVTGHNQRDLPPDQHSTLHLEAKTLLLLSVHCLIGTQE